MLSNVVIVVGLYCLIFLCSVGDSLRISASLRGWAKHRTKSDFTRCTASLRTKMKFNHFDTIDQVSNDTYRQLGRYSAIQSHLNKVATPSIVKQEPLASSQDPQSGNQEPLVMQSMSQSPANSAQQTARQPALRSLRPVSLSGSDASMSLPASQSHTSNSNQQKETTYHKSANPFSVSNADSKYAVSMQARFPTGAQRDQRFAGSTSDMELVFVGTASCTPNSCRGVSCLGMKFKGSTWLFDCGEGSQLNLQHSEIGQVSNINKIFITHLHGDHMFGISAMLCLLGSAAIRKDIPENRQVVDIYGPEGIRDYIRATIQLSYSRVAVPHRIHELKGLPNGVRSSVRTVPLTHFNEVELGNDYFPDAEGVYHLIDNDEVTVQAASMVHTVPCVGFVVREKDRKGRLRAERVRPLLLKHKEELEKKYNVRVLELLKGIKELNATQRFELPDGSYITGEEAVEQDIPGRKVVIMGDTNCGDHIQRIAADANVLVHEATLAYIPELSCIERYKDYEDLEADAKRHGHSTPQLAGAFAKKIRAKTLVLSHFSPRFGGDSSPENMAIMWKIEDMARQTSGLLGKNDVVAAWDMMRLHVPSNRPTGDCN